VRVGRGQGLGLGNQRRGHTLALLIQVQIQVRTVADARGLQWHMRGMRRKSSSLTALHPLPWLAHLQGSPSLKGGTGLEGGHCQAALAELGAGVRVELRLRLNLTLALALAVLGLRLLLLLLEERLLLQMVLLQSVLRQGLLLLQLLLLRLREQAVRRAVRVERARTAAGASRQRADHAGTHSAQVWSTDTVAGRTGGGVVDVIHAGDGGQAVRAVQVVPGVALLLVALVALLLQMGVLQRVGVRARVLHLGLDAHHAAAQTARAVAVVVPAAEVPARQVTRVRGDLVHASVRPAVRVVRIMHPVRTVLGVVNPAVRSVRVVGAVDIVGVVGSVRHVVHVRVRHARTVVLAVATGGHRPALHHVRWPRAPLPHAGPDSTAGAHARKAVGSVHAVGPAVHVVALGAALVPFPGHEAPLDTVRGERK